MLPLCKKPDGFYTIKQDMDGLIFNASQRRVCSNDFLLTHAGSHNKIIFYSSTK